AASGPDASDEALEVSDPAQALAKIRTQRVVVDESLDGIEAISDRARVGERAHEPGAKKPLSHARRRAIQDGDERATRASVIRFEQLEVAARRRVKVKIRRRVVANGPAKMLDVAALRRDCITAEQLACGFRGIGAVLDRRTVADHAARKKAREALAKLCDRDCRLALENDLRRRGGTQLVVEPFVRDELGRTHFAGGKIADRKSPRAASMHDGGQIARPVRREAFLV